VPHVTITETGRDGQVTYADGLRSIRGYWEFGGNDVVTIISMGTREEWQSKPWALDKRADILRFVAAEVIRQRAPTCRADIDEEGGVILLRQGPNAAAHPSTRAPARQAKAAAFVHRLRDLKEMLATGLIVIALVLGGLFWLGQQAMTVTAVSGTPLNASLRFAAGDPGLPGGIATLIQTTDPHAVEISGRGGNTTTSLSILVTPLDGATPHLVRVAGRLPPSGVQLSRIMGSDGRTLWFDAAGLHGVRLSDFSLVTPAELRAANPELPPTWWDDQRGMDIVDGKLHVMNADRSAALDVDPDTWKATATTPKPSNARFERREPADHLASGLLVGPGKWLGLHAPAERDADFKPGRWIRPVESASEKRLPRQLNEARLEPSSDGARHRVRAIAPLGDSEYLEAAFLRLGPKAEPLRLTDPDSALMIHTSAPGQAGTLVVSRVDMQGKLLWSTDTGLHRFSLKQILPGEDVVAFVGERPPIPDKLSEPLIVLVDTQTGKLTTHTLWR
jgi:hypothetical protein